MTPGRSIHPVYPDSIIKITWLRTFDVYRHDVPHPEQMPDHIIVTGAGAMHPGTYLVELTQGCVAYFYNWHHDHLFTDYGRCCG